MKTVTNTLLVVIMMLAISISTSAQVKFGDNKTSINAGSLLELESVNKGLLPPRINLTSTTTWSLLGSGVAGMQVFNSNAGITAGNASYPVLTGGTGIYYWDGSGWVGVTPLSVVSGKFWGLTGNSGTNSGTNFLGTTDNAALKLKVNSNLAGYIDSSATHGNLFMGLNAGNATTATGTGNSFYGTAAGATNTTGTNNSFFGYGADALSNALSNATAIGYNAKASASNTVVLGPTKNYTSGNVRVNVGIGKSDPRYMLDVYDSTSSGSTTIANFSGLTTNNYMQLNVQNRSASNSASSDIVATADNGGSHYIDMGINSSSNTNDDWGRQNGAYLFAGADTLHIGTQGSTAPLIFNTGSNLQANERMRIDQNGKVGINVTTPQKRLDINASTSGSSTTSTYDYLKVSNLAIDSASLGGTLFNNSYSQYLVIDTLNHLVGVSSSTNTSGQILRIGVNSTTYNASSNDQYLKFNSSNSSAEMGTTGNGTSNYINTITGSTMSENVTLTGGNGTPSSGTGDVINLPAGVYQVAVKLLGSTSTLFATPQIGIKFCTVSGTVSTEYNNFPGFVTSAGNTFFVQDLVSSSSSFGLTFTLNNNNVSNFTPTSGVAIAGGGNAWRSVIQVTRLR